MDHPQFEAVKVALKQDKTGYMLTLNIHPDDLDDRIMRDFVGARYQVVMVRLTDNDMPMVRGRDPVKVAAILCNDENFSRWLEERGEIFESTTSTATAWLKQHLGVESRADLKNNPQAAQLLWALDKEYQAWKNA